MTTVHVYPTSGGFEVRVNGQVVRTFSNSLEGVNEALDLAINISLALGLQ